MKSTESHEPKPAQESWLESAFVKCDGSHPEDQIVDGMWRHPKWGCDSLQHLMESFHGALAAERESHEKELDVVEANWSAQLAAEREKLRQYENLQGQGWFHPDIVNELHSQLAAEREAHKATEKQLSLNATEYMTLGSQLAAEREKLETVEEAAGNQFRAIGQLRSQLSAEQGRCERGLCKGAALFAGKEAETIQQLRLQLADKEGQIHALKQILAAEREKLEEAVGNLVNQRSENHELRSQLATERERYEQLQKYGEELAERVEHNAGESEEFYKRAEKAEKQLATTVELLKKCKEWMLSQHYAPDWNKQIDTALAPLSGVKEGK